LLYTSMRIGRSSRIGKRLRECGSKAVGRTLWCQDPVVRGQDPVGQDPVVKCQDPVGPNLVVWCQDPVVWCQDPVGQDPVVRCQDPVVWCQDPVSQDPVVWCQDPVSHNPVVWYQDPVETLTLIVGPCTGSWHTWSKASKQGQHDQPPAM
ncbi:hypothetical protein V8C86DRAFT_2766809, partial [Haematococcus lacustris]